MRAPLSLSAALFLLAAGNGASVEPVFAQAAQPTEFALMPGDVVEIAEANVVGGPEYRVRGRIRPDGMFMLPRSGQIRAAGLTPSQFSQAVADALRQSGLFVNPVIGVEVVAYSSNITVLGAVRTPGVLPPDRPYRLSEILARAGGALDTAAKHLVLTSADGVSRTLNIQGLATSGSEGDPRVGPGDKVYVPQAEQFFIYGQVNAPGAYPMMDAPTARKALARSGGLTPLGTERSIRLIRNGQELRGLPVSTEIKPGDVVIVGERLF